MDFSKLTPNEKLAVYGAAASVIGPILATISFGFGTGFLTLLLAIAMVAIVVLPQTSPQTKLPGSKGSLMLVVGGIAGVSSVLSLFTFLNALGILGSRGGLWSIGILVGIIGGGVMAWSGWQEFQAEGGKLQLGTQPGTPPVAEPPKGESAEPRRDDAPPSA